MTITRNGTQLTSQLTGQPTVDIYAQTPTHFFLKVVPATIDFVTDGTGAASALTLHQNGQNVTMPRIDDATATQLAAELAARIQNNTPQPGSEAAVRDTFDRIGKGLPPDYSKMTVQLANIARPQEPVISKLVTGLGPLQSISFQGVGASGNDSYVAKFEKGSLLVRINLDSKGIISALGILPYP